MKTLSRAFEMWIGEQASGKTTALRARVRCLAHMRSVTSVFVFDRLREWSPAALGIKSCEIYRRHADYLAKEEIPRVVIWQLGSAVDPYERVIAEAVRLGDCAIVIDEAYEFAPTGATWTGSHILRECVLAGRHLQRHDGELRPVHLIIATQYPKSVHHLMWSQANAIIVGRFSGENTSSWIVANFGKEHLTACEKLKLYHWHACRGEMPDLPGYGPNG